MTRRERNKPVHTADSHAGGHGDAEEPPAGAGTCWSDDIDLTATEASARAVTEIVAERPVPTLQPGDELGPCRIMRVLGSGSMGVVYEAIDTEHCARVALKTLRRLEARNLYRLKQEFRQIADIYHGNLVQLHQFLGWQGTFFFTMEYIEGVDFLRHVSGEASKVGGDREPVLRDALIQLVHGVMALHDAGIVHLDLKPSNVMVERGERLVILDFGIARTLRAAGASSRAGMGRLQGLAGTPAYMAPEQIRGEVSDPASDWYATGVMLFQALTGSLPFTGSSAHVITAKLDMDAPHPASLRPGLASELADLCARLLAREPGDRPDGAEILRILGAAAPAAASVPAAPPATLVGREAELLALQRAHAMVQGGAPVCALISGPPGIGKTALVERFLQTLPATTQIFCGRCYERESMPFKVFDPLVDALCEHLNALDLDRQRALFHPDLHETARIFPVLRGLAALDAPAGAGLPDDAPVERRRQAFHGLKHLLSMLCRSGPVVLFLDDIQWGDKDSVALLIELLSPPEPPPLLVLCTHRGQESLDSDFFDEWRRQTRDAHELELVEVAVLPLDPASAVHMVEGRCSDITAEQARAIAREADGNPFFIEELLRLTRSAHAQEARGADMTELVAARLKGLPDATLLVLQTVAVAGHPIAQTLALRASDVESSHFQHIGLLRSLSLVRTHGGRGRDAVEPYHERIRESILANLDAGETRRIHRALAHTLDGAASAEILAYHFHAAGELRQAAAHAATAADHAYEALAFDRAAAQYERALAWGRHDREQERALVARRAHALYNAGRCAEAAPLFLRAAPPDVDGRRELQRLAAEAYLVAGHIDEGIRVVKPLLRELGSNYPHRPWRLSLSLLGDIIQLLIRGIDFEPRARTESERDQLALVDLHWSLSKGLSVVAFFHGMHFTLSSLRGALQLGDPVRVGRALGCVGAYMSTIAPWTRSYLERAQAISEQHEDSYLQGIVLVWRGIRALFERRWREGVELGERAQDILQSHCVGAAWEENIAAGVTSVALVWTGNLKEAGELCNHRIRQARQRGDLYGQVLFTQSAAYCNLGRGDLELARQQARWVIESWTQREYTLQRAYSMRIEAYCDLYAGEPGRARERFLGEIQAMKRAGAYRQIRFLVDFDILEACIGLSLDDAGAAGLRRCEAIAHHLERGRYRDGPSHAALIRASRAAQRGDRIRALALLDRCIAQFERLGMGLTAACARMRKAELLRDHALMDEAHHSMVERGIQEPSSWLRVMAPGFTDS